MAAFWNDRAREDAFFFVDDRLDYGSPDLERFWAGGPEAVDLVLGQLGDPPIAPTDTVLDLGCGIGRLTRALAARAGQVIGLDVSAEMLLQAHAFNPALHNVDWRLGDGTSLSGIDDAGIDAAFSLVVFQHIPDPEITLGYVSELGRVLRPGGWAALQLSTDPAVHERTVPAADRLKARLGRAPRGQDDPHWLGSAVSLDALDATALQAGLELERIEHAGTQFCLVLARRARA